MYEYHWDEETGGILLTSNQSKFSKEPRPVYYRELDILGLDQYWKYPKEASAPLMWAEANNYIYKGRLVAKTKGGSLYTKPEIILTDEPESGGGMLQYVDIQTMCKKNRRILETLVQETIQKIYNTYIEYKSKIDIFYVAFSGGKDSVVALDLVQRTLPHEEFMVLFGDTQMEFSDTYDLIKKQKELCEKENIKFIEARSEQKPEDTWREFGSPAQTIRWCCSVHKTAPQILALRKLTGKPSFRGMAFTGIRGDESVSRSQYDYISYGEKHKGQYSYHCILDWSSAEVFLYIYDNKLLLNETYKKGNSRAGCLVCPMAGGKSFYFRNQSYGETTKYINIMLETISKKFSSEKRKTMFIDTCGWRIRKSGRDLNLSKQYCIENVNNGILTITLVRERTKWIEWIKTIGDIASINKNTIEIIFENKSYKIEQKIKGQQQIFSVDLRENTKTDIHFGSELKTVFRKSAYCIGCHVCEANCPNGYITMTNGEIRIDDRCIKCKKCHDVCNGCLVANSLRLPKEKNNMRSMNRTIRSMNRYDDMGAQGDWIKSYFSKKNDFWKDNGLGKNKIKNLRNFLSDADISKKSMITSFGEKISQIGINTEVAWGLIICNLVYTEEFNWWVLHVEFDKAYDSTTLNKMLEEDEANANIRRRIISAFKNTYSTNDILGKALGLGVCQLKEKSKSRVLIDITRTKWENPIPEVILYSLFKFAEACGGYYQFSLSTLLDNTIERDGISPTRIFGIDREGMIGLLNNLSSHYPEFIRASFTLDLETITLSENKTAENVLELL